MSTAQVAAVMMYLRPRFVQLRSLSSQCATKNHSEPIECANSHISSSCFRMASALLGSGSAISDSSLSSSVSYTALKFHIGSRRSSRAQNSSSNECSRHK